MCGDCHLTDVKESFIRFSALPSRHHTPDTDATRRHRRRLLYKFPAKSYPPPHQMSSAYRPGVSLGAAGCGRYLAGLWLLGALVTAHALFYTDTANDMPKLGRRSSAPGVFRSDGTRGGERPVWDKRAPSVAESRLAHILDRAARTLRAQDASPEVDPWRPEVMKEDPLESWLSEARYRRRLLSTGTEKQ